MTEELHELIIRTVAMLDNMEVMEHRVATIIEGQRQQASHLMADLKIPDMRAELRAISTSLKAIEKKLT